MRRCQIGRLVCPGIIISIAIPCAAVQNAIVRAESGSACEVGHTRPQSARGNDNWRATKTKGFGS